MKSAEDGKRAEYAGRIKTVYGNGTIDIVMSNGMGILMNPKDFDLEVMEDE